MFGQPDDDPGILFSLYTYDSNQNVIFKDLEPGDYQIPGPALAEFEDDNEEQPTSSGKQEGSDTITSGDHQSTSAHGTSFLGNAASHTLDLDSGTVSCCGTTVSAVLFNDSALQETDEFEGSAYTSSESLWVLDSSANFSYFNAPLMVLCIVRIGLIS